ncbi:MAG TPA: hypothetical protein VFS45_00875 [Sphingomicrobium sp.]|nr:hypothetical protein [Sphingomicrobium sp.]
MKLTAYRGDRMTGAFPFRGLLAGLAALVAPALAQAAPVAPDRNATATAQVSRPAGQPAQARGPQLRLSVGDRRGHRDHRSQQ